MAYEQKPNTGSLFANKEKTADTHANAKGSAVIEGVHYFCDAWTNTAPDGSKYQSLKFKRKDKQPGSPPPETRQAPRKTAFDDMDSDIPPF